MTTSALHRILDRASFSPRTKESYTRVIEQWLDFTGHDPRRWTRPEAQAFYDDMLARGVSPGSANVYIASLRYVSKWYAIAENRPDFDFAIVQQREDTRYVDNDAPKKIRHALSPDEARALIEACNGTAPIDQRDQALIIVGLETGMRRMSLAGMTQENIGKQNGYPIAKVPIKGKGGHAMFEVPLSSTAMKVITKWRGWLHKQDMKKGAVFTGLNKRMGKGRDVYTPTGTISLPSIYKIIATRAKAAGIEGMHPHLLRHTFVTWRQMEGLSAIQIASITGHKTFGSEWANMKPYIDMAVVAEQARESTPPWLVKLVDEL